MTLFALECRESRTIGRKKLAAREMLRRSCELKRPEQANA